MGNFMMMMTCTVCKTKQTKIFTKRAYYHGSVLIRCEGCPTVHLVADNLGWFEDEAVNIEQIMAKKGEEVKRLKASPESLDMFKEKIAKTRERSKIQRAESARKLKEQQEQEPKE